MSSPSSQRYSALEIERQLDDLQGWVCVLLGLAAAKRDLEPEALRVIAYAIDECRSELFDNAGINMGVPR